MTDRPIIFSAPMIAALLSGRKTMTRRVIKPQPELNDHGLWVWPPYGQPLKPRYKGFCQTADDDLGLRPFLQHAARCGYAPGDRLWVREVWCPNALISGVSVRSAAGCLYRADGQHVVMDDGDGFAATTKSGAERSPWRSPIHMPRWASRLTLHVTDVRVERLQGISEEDAIAEGSCAPEVCEALDLCGGHDADMCACQCVNPSDLFSGLWESFHGRGAWTANPWVAAITFRPEQRNIDA